MARGNSGEPGDPHADLAGNGMPIDVAAVRRDDALIDAISAEGPVATDSPEEYQVAALLSNWRAEILAQPMPAEPDLDDIVARVQAELGARDALVTRTRSGRSHLRLLRPIAAAAAVVAIAMGGMTIFSYNAEPGDPLWGVKQVVFTERAASTVAKIDTTSSLEEAERLIASGDAAGAKAKLDSAGARANAVNEAGTRDELNVWRERLLTELQRATTAPAPIVPPAPDPSTSTAVDSSTIDPGAELSPSNPGLPGLPIDPRSLGILPGTSSAPSSSAAASSTPTTNPATPSSGTPTPTTTTTAPSSTSTTKASSGSLGGPSPATPSP